MHVSLALGPKIFQRILAQTLRNPRSEVLDLNAILKQGKRVLTLAAYLEDC
jgi:hypothetical protein